MTPSTQSPSSKHSILKHYEQIAFVSGQMLQSAHKQDWHSVLRLSSDYFEAVEKLRQLEPFSESERSARKALLNKILDNDARIRNLAAPEMVRLETLIGNIKRQKSAIDTYNTEGTH